MNEIFELKNEHPYNLRQHSQYLRPLVKSLYHRTESLSYLGSKSLGHTPKHLQKYRWSTPI